MSTNQTISETLNILDPAKVSFDHTELPFKLNVTIAGITTHANIFAMSAFPLSASQELIHLYERTAEGTMGKLIGVIENSQQLSKENCFALTLLLKRNCHLPRILSVIKILDEFHYFHWFVETDRGSSDFFIGSPRKHISTFDNNDLLIKDLNGDMYHIADKTTLDKKSQDLISTVC